MEGWTSDPSSSNFIPSLALQCDKGNSKHVEFMINSGKCMTHCSKSDQDVFSNDYYPQSCDWFNQHQQDQC